MIPDLVVWKASAFLNYLFKNSFSFLARCLLRWTDRLKRQPYRQTEIFDYPKKDYRLEKAIQAHGAGETAFSERIRNVVER